MSLEMLSTRMKNGEVPGYTELGIKLVLPHISDSELKSLKRSIYHGIIVSLIGMGMTIEEAKDYLDGDL